MSLEYKNHDTYTACQVQVRAIEDQGCVKSCFSNRHVMDADHPALTEDTRGREDDTCRESTADDNTQRHRLRFEVCTRRSSGTKVQSRYANTQRQPDSKQKGPGREMIFQVHPQESSIQTITTVFPSIIIRRCICSPSKDWAAVAYQSLVLQSASVESAVELRRTPLELVLERRCYPELLVRELGLELREA